ncbi:MAG: zinc-binding dehydrogenase [Gemmataceae bacterium]|nr:zinc-binding dehydrogenase [Gemmataceae bacterium]
MVGPVPYQWAEITEAGKVALRTGELAAPGPSQIRVRTLATAVSPGTELAVYTGTHQWLRDPAMTDWKFPFRPGYSAAGVVDAVGSEVPDWKPGDRVCYPGNHASSELLTLGHERGRLWRIPDSLTFEDAAWACIARYGFGAAIRAGLTLGRSAAVLGLGVIGQFALRGLVAAGAYPVIGIDRVTARRQAAQAGGADHVIDPSAGEPRDSIRRLLGGTGAEVVVDATGIPDCVPQAMRLACDAGQVIVVGSPRGVAGQVNFYDDLHRRSLEVSGAHGNMLFESSHSRLAGAWDIDKAQRWLIAALASRRLSLAGLVTHSITGDQLREAYEGLLHSRETHLGVVINWVRN